MARITTNTTGTQPVIKIDLATDSANVANNSISSSSITLPFVQDITITNSTGVYSYTTFSDVDTRKLSTPADNEISMNIVIDDTTWFGTGSGSAADDMGIQKISLDKELIYFEIYYSGTGAGAKYRSGLGFVTSLAPTTSPEAPVFVTPISIAVDGAFVDDVVAP